MSSASHKGIISSPPASNTHPTSSTFTTPSAQPKDKIKNAILQSSTTGWSPLRLASPQRNSNGSINGKAFHPQTPVRRTSSSFSHVRNNNLVSNSPFVRPSPSTFANDPSTPRMQARVPTSRRTSNERRASFERKRARALPNSNDTENTRPQSIHAMDAHNIIRRRPKESKGFSFFEHSEHVSKSPFRGSTSEPIVSSASSSGSFGTDITGGTDPDTDEDKSAVTSTPQRVPTPQVLTEGFPQTPTPTQVLASSNRTVAENSSPRSNLVSKRLHGPRTSAAGRRARSKTVTFDERCDVVEFDAESFEHRTFEEDSDAIDEDGVFQSDFEVDYDPQGPRRMVSSDEDTGINGHETREDSYMSDPEGETGFVSSYLAAQEQSPSPKYASPSSPPRPKTPPVSDSVPPDEDTEDGVPYGRTHRAERFKAAHSQASPASGTISTLTPSRPSLGADILTSPSPARTLPRRPTTLHEEAESDDDEGSVREIGSPAVKRLAGLGRSPLQPLGLSPSRPSKKPETIEDPFGLSPIAETSPVASSGGNVFTTPLSANPVQHPRTGTSSLESSTGSIGGRGSPRISKDEVRKRLLKSRAAMMEGDELRSSGDEREDSPSRHGSSARSTTFLPTPSVPISPGERPVSASFDLHKPGVDLGDVHSALDRLMLGVEQGFSSPVNNDDVDMSFADETANSSMVIDTRMTRTDVDGAESVFVSAGEMITHTQRPAICPPSPLLSTRPIEFVTSDAPSAESERTPSIMTETTEDGESGPHTPSVQSFPSPVTVTAPELMSPSSAAFNNGRLYPNAEARLPAKDSVGALNKNKALPATPQPRLSLDISIGGATFGQADFGDLTAPLNNVVDSNRLSVTHNTPLHRTSTVSSTASTMSGKEAIRAHEAAIIAKRRAMRRRERGEHTDSDGSGSDDDRPLRRQEGRERPQSRRSRSTGDALDVRAQKAAEDRTEARKGSGNGPAGIINHASVEEPALGTSIRSELDKMPDQKDKRTYHLRERTTTIYASSSPKSDNKVAHLGDAGDVDNGKAWRTVRRPSDMNEYAREIKEYRSQEKPGKAHGKVFVKVLGVKGLNVPIPRLPTLFTCTLNNGIHFVTTPECQLEKDSAIDQEFELIEHAKLEFTLTLKVKKESHLEAAVRRPYTPLVITPPAPLPSKSGGLRAFLTGSPKKSRPAKSSTPPSRVPSPPSLPVEDTLIKYLKADGTLGRSFLSFRDVAHLCDTQVLETGLDLVSVLDDRPSKVSPPKSIGEIIIQVFRLPPLPGIAPDDLPQSLEECLRGMRHVAWHKVIYHEGVLTQNGGDCTSWRRRQFRVIGAKLVSFNDVTKKATATIDLSKVIGVHDDSDPAASSNSLRRRASESYDAIFKVERSFRLLFTDDEEIEFFADTDEDKAKWLHIFRALTGRIPPNPLWAELVWQRQQDLAIANSYPQSQ